MRVGHNYGLKILNPFLFESLDIKCLASNILLSRHSDFGNNKFKLLYDLTEV